MSDLAALDLVLRTNHPSHPHERRIEMRIASSGAFVAWFCLNVRASGTEEVTSIATQFIHREELSEEQVTAVKNWLKEETLLAI